MTTVTVVKKEGRIAIAADTLTKWGGGKESADYVANHEKIIRVGDSLVAITGSATFKLILADYFSALDEPPLFDSTANIFRAWNTLHAVLKEQYYLQTGEDKEEDLESSRMDVLIANPHGIFGVAAHRTVQEFSKFYAYGSGSSYALGAMYAAYRAPSLDAEAVARLGVMAAAEFHDETGLPVQSFVMDMNPDFKE
jgi:ATP-dependent protease HslVU (ClpYQ) peptidase subunit